MAQPEDTVKTDGSPAATNQALKDLDDRLDEAGGGGGEVTVDSISDAGTVGKAALLAETQAAARGAIGAGTGNGSSNLTIGTAAGNAAAGNHTHADFTAINATVTGLDGRIVALENGRATTVVTNALEARIAALEAG